MHLQCSRLIARLRRTKELPLVDLLSEGILGIESPSQRPPYTVLCLEDIGINKCIGKFY